MFFPQLKYLTCLKEPYINRQITCLYLLSKTAIFDGTGHWYSKLFSFSKRNRKEEQAAWETIPGKQHKNVQNTTTINILQQLPPVPCSCRRNVNVWKEQLVQSNRHFQWEILVSLPVIKIFTFVCSPPWPPFPSASKGHSLSISCLPFAGDGCFGETSQKLIQKATVWTWMQEGNSFQY